jgi:hypothetical protein
VFARFLDDGRICLTNNAAERVLRGIALGRKSWLFAGSDRGGHRAAVMYSMIVSAKINVVDSQAWLAYVLGCIAQHPINQLSCSRSAGCSATLRIPTIAAIDSDRSQPPVPTEASRGFR